MQPRHERLSHSHPRLPPQAFSQYSTAMASDLPPVVRVALLTPSGRGALAVVGVRGLGVGDLIAQRFTPRSRKPLAEWPDGGVIFGRWGDPEHGEELVVVRHTADRLEIHCHGGLAASEAVMRSLEALGAERCPGMGFGFETFRASGSFSRQEIEREARDALPHVAGPRAARILCRQLAGALADELERIEFLRRAGNAEAVCTAVARLRKATRVGLRLGEPWRVVVTGPVNAGKSSLVNAIAGYARSIVSAEPGTTRDALTTRLVLSGWEIDLIDTAGFRSAGTVASPTERAGIERALAAAGHADLVLDVEEASEAACVTMTNREATMSGAPKRLKVWSKIDRTTLAISGTHPLATSAATGQGIDHLITAMISALVPEEASDPSLLRGAMPFTAKQAHLLSRYVAT
jgi:tRNA modification GTPase